MKKETKVAEVEVLTPDQIAEFPKVVKENIQFLSEEMNPRDLTVFNPLVSELLRLREIGSKLKLRNPSPDGEFDKDNIQQFVDVKKDVRSYRAEVKRSGKALRDPYIKIQKGVVAIEKVFIEEATKVYDQAEKEFAPYIKEEERKAAEKEAEKNKELIEAARIAEEDAERERLKSLKTNVVNEIKFNKIGTQITEKSTDLAVSGNESSILEFMESLRKLEFGFITSSLDISILDEETLEGLEANFDKAIKNALALLDGAVRTLTLQREKDIADAIKEQQANTPTTPAPAPAPASVPTPPSNQTDEEFMETIMLAVINISGLINKRINDNPKCSPRIYKAKAIINSVKSSI